MTAEEVVAQMFGLSPDDVQDETSPESVEDWDSLAHVNLVMELESQFGVALSTDDALAMTDVGAIKRVLTAHGVELGP